MATYSIEKKDPEFKFPHLCGNLNFPETSNLEYLDILLHSDLRDPELKEGKLDKTSLFEWLSEPAADPHTSPEISLPRSTSKSVPIAGRLRILYGECSFDEKNGLTLPFSKDSWRQMDLQFGFPKSLLKDMKLYVSPNYKHTSLAPQNRTLRRCFVFKFGMLQPSWYQLVLSYNTSTRITYGLLLSNTSEHELPRLIESLKEDPWGCTQPLYPALVVAELSVLFSAERIQHTELKLNELEQAMGQHEYTNMRKDNPIKIDFESTTPSLNFHSQWMAVQSMRLNSVLLALDNILRETSEMTNENISRVAEKNETRGFDNLTMMKEFVARLVNIDKNLLFRAAYEKERIDALTPVVRQYMAHKNAIINNKVLKYSASLAEASKENNEALKTIALETRKDSSAMKTIAIIGIVFLPGAVVAAIFAMPVFDWDDGGAPVPRVAFKYYMAITVTLTVGVLVSWVLAVNFPWRLWLAKRQPRACSSEEEIELEGVNLSLSERV